MVCCFVFFPLSTCSGEQVRDRRRHCKRLEGRNTGRRKVGGVRVGLEAKLEARMKGRVGWQAGLVRRGLQSWGGGWEWDEGCVGSLGEPSS